MSLAEARRLRAPEVNPSAETGGGEAVAGRPTRRSTSDDREVILEVVILSIELTDEFPSGIADLVRSADPSGGLENASVGLLDQPLNEFLERLERMASMQVLTRPRLRVFDGEVARLETGPHPVSFPGSSSKRPLSPVPYTRLEIRPRVVSDGGIELEVTQSQLTSELGAANASPLRLTRALVSPGRTVVLGGVFHEDAPATSTADDANPRRPRLLARLLGGRSELTKVPSVGPTRRELIVLVTPRLVDLRTGESAWRARR